VRVNDGLGALCGIGASQFSEHASIEDDGMAVAIPAPWPHERRVGMCEKRLPHGADGRRRNERQVHERDHHGLDVVVPLLHRCEPDE